MNLTAAVKLPPVPKVDDEKLARYLADLDRAVREAFQQVYIDLSQGKATLTSYSAAPTVAQLADGQVVVRTDAGNEKLYVRVGAAVKSAALS
jgi:hypothetical protein